MVSLSPQRLIDFKKKIHHHLIELLNDPHQPMASNEPSAKRKNASSLLRNLLDSYRDEIPPELDKEYFIKELLDQSLGLGLLEDFIHDESISEIMVNGPHQIYIEKEGCLQKIPSHFQNQEEIMNVIEKIVAPLGRRIDEASPLVDARLADGSRVNAIIPPLALNGPCITIRKFKPIPFTSQDYIENGTLTHTLLEFLKFCVRGRCNILISGGTGSGKTTLLNLLTGFIPQGERIITIEDAAELRLPQDHVISLESRPANIEGSGQITIRTLVRNALRMRPDRIVVGECRGGEALDMLQAMNTGHDGSLTTGHANGTRDMLLRLETMVLMSGVDLPIRAIREQISSAVDLIIQIERFPGGKRRITRVTEVCGMEGETIVLQDIFTKGMDINSVIEPTGFIPHFRKFLMEKGVNLPIKLLQNKRIYS